MDTELEIVTDVAEDLSVPWFMYEDEPEEWYEKFIKYYLPLGPTRSLQKAYMAYVAATDPDRHALMMVNKPQSVIHSWAAKSKEWNWRERAIAHDAFQLREVSAAVEQARREIQLAAPDAVKTLKDNLPNAKQGVNAAKEILNRAGLPANTVTTIRISPFTADEYAEATQGVDAWLQAQKESRRTRRSLPVETNPEESGSSASSAPLTS